MSQDNLLQWWKYELSVWLPVISDLKTVADRRVTNHGIAHDTSSRSDVTTVLCPDPYLRGHGPFRTWLQRVIKNRGFDQIKKTFSKTWSPKHEDFFLAKKNLGVRCTLNMFWLSLWSSTVTTLSLWRPRSTPGTAATFHIFTMVFRGLEAAWHGWMSAWTNAEQMLHQCAWWKDAKWDHTMPLISWFAKYDWGRWSWRLRLLIWGGQRGTTNWTAGCVKIKELHCKWAKHCQKKNANRFLGSTAGTALYPSSKGGNRRPYSGQK